MQYSASFNVLEVQCQSLTFIFFGFREQRRTVFLSRSGWIDFDGEFVIRLIGKLLIFTVGRNYDARIEVRAQRINRRDRSSEVHNIETTHQLGRQACIFKHGDNATAFLADVDRRGRICQINDNPATAITCAAEIDAINSAAT